MALGVGMDSRAYCRINKYLTLKRLDNKPLFCYNKYNDKRETKEIKTMTKVELVNAIEKTGKVQNFNRNTFLRKNKDYLEYVLNLATRTYNLNK